jgi:hypothetical protein
MTLEQVEQEALNLSLDVRALLAQKLLKSVAQEQQNRDAELLEQLSPWARSLLGIAQTDAPAPTDEEVKRDYEAYLEAKYS